MYQGRSGLTGDVSKQNPAGQGETGRQNLVEKNLMRPAGVLGSPLAWWS